ncbi:hypothetical protein GUITHDRAFT_159506 [Guillardia theta CCMP2712]|uniref:VOC domain-containing protein n=1 Tax=Guillardia theta (strain CCMP2712) TaxID=905079 RepID=L1JJS4_GUITC|nr:hypothetical protein GUITHDRAFT_159506 [Guillardia theta CCMP2712]EKX48404.1 hypothetical protein GUITHDRAFT_159506 [Guillardia theta CCMP2712]|eukprot:XP_005835384.1 hypothetical protein GUITHDRAFT_159506 [Guillardia theta CCMP2712]
MSTSTVSEKTIFKQAGYRRPLHWVFKIGSLEKSLEFYQNVFGMHVHRHEEFASGCEATCNGPYGGAWSKTMIGYKTEESNFALELTYNYGIDSYMSGNDLRYIALRASALKSDPSKLGYKTETDPSTGNKIVTGPDGYKFMVVDTSEGNKDEPFLFVSINVQNLDKALNFHTKVLGAQVFQSTPGALGSAKSAVIGFSDKGTRLELVELPNQQSVDHALAAGRFATETEDGAPSYMGEKVKSAGGKILHGPIKLQPHNEEVVIVEDVDGYEYCFVDARGYTNCVNVAYAEGGREVDWDFRNRLETASRSTKNAKLEVAKVLARNYNKAEVKTKVEDKIKDNGAVVFSQTSCPFCAKAKKTLSDLGAKYEVVELDKLGDEGYAWRVELAEITQSGTVPQVFIGGKFVGGFSDGVEELVKEGKLKPMLEQAGAM